MLTIRNGNADDYPAIVAIINAATPERATSVQKMQQDDAARPEACAFGFLCGERAGEMIGFARYAQYADLYQPGKFWIQTSVLPQHEGHGYGRALFKALRATLAPLQPRVLRASVREDRKGAMIWAYKQGFREVSKRYSMTLNVAAFDCSSYDALIAAIEAQGIRLCAVADIKADPKWVEKLYRLFCELDAQVPIDDTVSMMSRRTFRAQVIEAPYFLAEGSYVACDGNEYIGLSLFFKAREGVLDIDLTGTEYAYRRQGIATALKVKGIAYAQQHDYHTINTTNDAVNTGIITINKRMGFLQQPAIVQFARDLTRE